MHCGRALSSARRVLSLVAGLTLCYILQARKLATARKASGNVAHANDHIYSDVDKFTIA
jgi:hypothetical protein